MSSRGQKPEGTSKGGWLYLTVDPESSMGRVDSPYTPEGKYGMFCVLENTLGLEDNIYQKKGQQKFLKGWGNEGQGNFKRIQTETDISDCFASNIKNVKWAIYRPNISMLKFQGQCKQSLNNGAPTLDG